jgi:hypothetical protein
MTSRAVSRLVLILNLALAYVVGVITIVGFFTRGSISDIAGRLAQWAAVVVAFALLVGIGNLIKVHLGRVVRRSEGWLYSLLTVGSALAVIGVGLIGGRGPGDESVAWIFQWVYQPLGAAIFSLLAFFITTAFFRALRVRSAEAVVLLVVAFLVVIGSAPFSYDPGPIYIMADIKNWIFDYPMLAGMRAILMGVAFGAIGISLRVLLGFDRPYME